MEELENMDWEHIPSPAEYQKELKKIRRNLRKRNAVLVLTSLILAAALLFGTVRYGIPALESRYWDPETVSYGTHTGSDLDMVFAAYSDLFCPASDITNVKSTHTGFSSYSIAISYYDYVRNEPVEFCYGTLEKGELFLPDGIWEYAYGDKIGTLWMTIPESNKINKRHFSEKLSQLPEYIQVAAYVTFAEEKTVKETLDFFDGLGARNADQINQTSCHWMAVRHSADMDFSNRCGISLTTFTDWYPEANEQYPAFSELQAYQDLQQSGSTVYNRSQTYETHFKSVLQYMDDQLKNGTGIPAPALPTGEVDPDFYANTLAYVENNGVMIYGCYITASPQTLLELMEREDVLMVYPTDGWLNI